MYLPTPKCQQCSFINWIFICPVPKNKCLNPHEMVCVIDCMGCSCKTSNWNYARSGDELASGPGVILDDMKDCIHIYDTLPCVSEANQKPRLPTLKSPSLSHGWQTQLFSLLVVKCIFWQSVIMLLIVFSIKNISAHVVLYFQLQSRVGEKWDPAQSKISNIALDSKRPYIWIPVLFWNLKSF